MTITTDTEIEMLRDQVAMLRCALDPPAADHGRWGGGGIILAGDLGDVLNPNTSEAWRVKVLGVDGDTHTIRARDTTTDVVAVIPYDWCRQLVMRGSLTGT